MKKFKFEDMIAGLALGGIFLLFAALALRVSARAILLCTVLLAGTSLTATWTWQQLVKNGTAKPVLRMATLAAVCLITISNMVYLVGAAGLAVNGSGFGGGSFNVTAVSDTPNDSTSTVTITETQISVDAVSRDPITSGCDNTGTTLDQDTVRVTITNSKTAALQFTLAVSDTVTINTEGIAVGAVVLNPQASIEFVVVSPAGTDEIANLTTNGTITVTDISTVSTGAPEKTNFIFYKGGSYTVDGTAITEDTQIEQKSDHAYVLAATTSSGYEHIGWMSENNGFFSDSTYTATEGTVDTVYPLFVKTDSAIYSIQGTNLRYGYFDEALDGAGVNGTIVVERSGTLYGYNNQTSFNITSGQRLLVPFSATDAGVFGAMYKDASLVSGANPTTYRYLTVPSGTTITCDGQINVNGQRKVTGQGATGTGIPKGGHGKIILNGTGSQLTIGASGKLFCYGFITGTGTVEVNGEMHELMQVYDWAGGTNIFGWYSGTSSGKNSTLFFTSHYYVQNIEAPLKVNSGAVAYIEAVLTASNTEVHSSEIMIGTTNASEGLFLLGDGTSLTRTYDATTDRMHYTLGGSGDVGFGSIKVSVSSYDLNSADYTLPLNNAITLQIASGVTMNMGNRSALIPGSELIIDEGGKLNLTNHMYIMDIADKAGLFFANQLAPLYTAGRGSTVKMAVTASGRLEVNGELTTSGNGAVYTTAGPNSSATSSTDKIIYGTGTITNGGTLGAGSLRGGYSSSLTTLTVPNAIANLAGDGDMKNLASGTYHGLGEDHNNYWYINTADVGATCTANEYTKYYCTDASLYYPIEKANTALGHKPGAAASCTTAQTCTVCNAELAAATGHTYGAPVFDWDEENFTTCTASISCTVCDANTTGHTLTAECGITPVETPATCKADGKIVYTAVATLNGENVSDTREKILPLDVNAHPYNSVVTKPTCTERGYTTQKCTLCEYTQEINYTDALGHNYESVVTAPTCAEAGYTTHTCSNCGDTYTDGETEAAGHSYQDTVTAPTCTAAGYTTHTCSVCGDTYKDSDVAATGHSYKSVVTAPTCTAEGYTTYTCACGDTYTGDKVAAAGHSYGDGVTTTAPGCETEGVKTFTCGTCGGTKTEAISATGHSYESVVTAPTCDEDGYTTFTCACGKSYIGETVAKLGHDYDTGVVTTAPTCTETGVKTYTCQRTDCGATRTENVAATGHTEVIDAAVAPTCTETGLTEGKHCSVCKAVLTAQTVVDVLGHTEVADEAVAPSCDKTGLTAGSHCSVCNTVLVAQQVVPAAHTNVVTDEAVTPSCGETGLTEGSHCADCGTVIKAQEVVDALEHSYTSAVTPPTCTKDGYTTYTCGNCGDSYVEDHVDAAHTPVVDEAVAPSCTETGLTEGSHCSACGQTLTAQTVVAALGHSYDDGVVTQDPTCTDAGVETFTCGTCGDTKTEEVAATGHSYDDGVVTSAPTCTAAGVKTFTCSCGDSYTETIAATGHENTTTTTVDADCVNAGSTTVTCDDCGATVSTTVIPATGHTAKVVEGYDATCTETGLTEGKKCATCGETTVAQEEIAALGHDYEATVTKAATCTEAGVKTYTCKNDSDHTYTEAIAATDHTSAAAVVENNIDPDCLNAGSYDSVVYCSVCNAELSRTAVTVDALGHDWDTVSYEWVGLIEPDPEAPDLTALEASAEGTDVTCTATRICKRDGEHQETAVAVVTVEASIAATCTTAGEGTYTAVFEETWAETQEKTGIIPAAGHKETATVVAPTCTAAGYTAVSCLACDYTRTDPGEAALGHSYGNWTTLKEATCTATGQERRDCVRCDAYETNTLTTIGHREETIPAVAPTCTETGLTEGKKCAECDQILTEQTVVDALGHKFNDGTVTTAPTCTGEGVKTFTCSVCGGTKTEAVAALGHTEETIPAVAPTCTETGLTAGEKCSVCGEILTAQEEVSANGHTKVTDAGKSATCKETGLTEGAHCGVCGEVLVAQKVIPAIGHNYDEGEVTTPATCTEAGVMTYTCQNNSSHTYTEPIAAKGHTEVIDAAVAATCTSSGLTEGKHCEVCGEVLVAQTVVDALGHTAVVDAAVAPTCTATGLTEGSHCETCGETLVAQTVVAARGHTEEIIAAVAPTCTETGLTEGKKCSVCGEVLTAQTVVNALGHKYDSVVTAPTCTEAGYTTHTCSVCGDTYTDSSVAALGHTEEDVPGRDATCTVTGLTVGKKCTVCGVVTVAQTEIPATGHSAEVVAAVAPTCTATGLTEGSKCGVCGETLVAQEVVDAQGHDMKETQAKEDPTCTEDGTAAVMACSRCDHTTGGEMLPAIQHDWSNADGVCKNDSSHICGHSWVNGVCSICGKGCVHQNSTAVTEPDCTNGGYTTDTCGICGLVNVHSHKDALGHDMAAATCTEKAACKREDCDYTEGEALGHNHAAAVTAPTCTEKGYTTYTCSVCGDTYTGNEVAALGHTSGTPVEVEGSRVDATCDADGSYKQVTNCSVCGSKISEETITLTKTGHSYAEEWTVITPATCTANGEQRKNCSKCEKYLSQTIPATGHTEGSAVVENETAATCNATGSYDNVVYCTVCDAELSRTTVITEKNGNHSYEAVVTAPTCTAQGYTTYTCSLCGNSHSDNYVAALGHDEETVVTAPTCTAAGYTTYTCSTCGVSRTADNVDALGHSYSEKVTTEPTCTAEGVKTFTCSTCGDSYTEVIAASGHSYTTEVTAPTCTEAGYTTNTCSTCGDTYKSDEVEALGHTEETIPGTPATCTKTGLTDGVKCTVCGEIITEQEEIPATGEHSYVDGTCTVCGEADTSKPVYDLQQGSQLGLIEPWFIRINLYLYDESIKKDYTIPQLNTLYDYGVYYVRASQIDVSDGVTIEEIINAKDTVHYRKGDAEIQIASGTNGGGRITSTYSNGIYTYQLNDGIYTLYYVQDTENSTVNYDDIQCYNFYELAKARAVKNNFGEKERAVYTAMVEMFDKITTYRSQFTAAQIAAAKLPVMDAPYVTAGLFDGYKTDYEFQAGSQIVLVEPWGLTINSYLQSVEDFDEYGAVLLVDKGSKLTAKPTIDELLNNQSAYLFSTKNENDAFVSKDSVETKIKITYNKDINTYEHDTTFYLVAYARRGDDTYVGNVKVYNLMDLVETRKDKTSFKQVERDVYYAMSGLRQAVVDYRAWWYANNS